MIRLMDNDDIPGSRGDNDNDDDGTPRQVFSESGRVPATQGAIISLQHERLERNQRTRELEELMDEVYRLARERPRLAAREEPDLEDVYLKQYVALTGAFTKLLTISHKHRTFLREESDHAERS